MFLTIGAGVNPAWGQGVQPVVVPSTQPVPAGPIRLTGELDRAYQTLIAPGGSLAERSRAAGVLLGANDPEATRALVRTVTEPAQPEARRAVCQAMVISPDPPPTGLAEPLASLVGEIQPEMLDDWGAALGRFDDPRLTRRLMDIAQDIDRQPPAPDPPPAPDAAAVTPEADAASTPPSRARLEAIAALGHTRSQRVARALVDLLGDDQPEPVQDAAARALGVLSGLETLGVDRAAWQRWWGSAGRASTLQWERQLRDNFARRRTADRVQQQQLVQRLVESQQALYRATSAEDRPAVLVYMLSDPVESIRNLGLDLALRRLLDGQQFGDPLREALRARLADDSPRLRERAVLLLRDLLDKPAADAVARRLAARGAESVTSVLRADLKMMARLPRPAMVLPAYDLMDDANLRNEAAGALAAAAEHGVLTKRQTALALRKARDVLRAGRAPAPQVVTLLGEVGEEADWQRIAKWIEDPDPEVKQAAAEAWADSDRSLQALAERSGDPVIQPIVIAAATRRGADPWTLQALALHPPDQAQARQAWERALVAMAGRLPADSVLPAVRSIQDRDGTAALRESMLSAVLANPPADPDSPSRARLSLQLQRGLTRLDQGDAAGALDDLQPLVPRADRLAPEDREALSRARIRAHLLTAEIDQAFDVARALLGREKTADAPVAAATDDPMVGLFIQAAKRMSTLNHDDQAQRVLRELRLLLGPKIKPEVAQRIAVLEARIRGRTLPEAVPDIESADGAEQPGAARQSLDAGGA